MTAVPAEFCGDHAAQIDELQRLALRQSTRIAELEAALRGLVDHFEDERPDVTDWRYDLHETYLPRARAALANDTHDTSVRVVVESEVLGAEILSGIKLNLSPLDTNTREPLPGPADWACGCGHPGDAHFKFSGNAYYVCSAKFCGCEKLHTHEWGFCPDCAKRESESRPTNTRETPATTLCRYSEDRLPAPQPGCVCNACLPAPAEDVPREPRADEKCWCGQVYPVTRCAVCACEGEAIERMLKPGDPRLCEFHADQWKIYGREDDWRGWLRAQTPWTPPLPAPGVLVAGDPLGELERVINVTKETDYRLWAQSTLEYRSYLQGALNNARRRLSGYVERAPLLELVSVWRLCVSQCDCDTHKPIREAKHGCADDLAALLGVRDGE